jgi:photoactive yellow protein
MRATDNRGEKRGVFMELLDETLYQRIDEMKQAELDVLPQGAIQLDLEGRILQYNLYEQRLAHVKRENAVGRNFFTEVAPCTDVKGFHGRFTEGVKKKSLHETFRYHFSFPTDPTDVSITLHYSASTSSVWVFVRKLE